MKYLPPVNGNGADPNRGWPNADPANGLEGAIPDGAAIEHPLRELHALIATSGFTPSAGDLQQVAKAVRSQHLNYFLAAGGANAYAITMSPPPASLAEIVGTPLKIMFPWANTGPSTLTINGSTVPLTRVGAAALVAGDIPAWGLMEATYDGARAQLAAVAPAIIVPPAVAGRFLSMQFLTVSGTYIPNPSAATILAIGIGGGGGGGGGNGQSDGGGGGGGGGETFISVISPPPAGVPITIGAGGSAGQNATSAVGGTGGATALGSYAWAAGGLGGTAGQAPTLSLGAGGGGGIGGIGQITIPGSAGSPSSGQDGGAGGAGLFGGGGGRGERDNAAPTSATGGNGFYGGGGGGGDLGVGGSGGNGAILILEYS
ncbi:hypothetical protein V5G24_04110 [Xanthobacter sp. VTT E-85241]|uniref:glycine-rich domain-containing protein n=1 Tax=Roseixanthobacter finlandensis TaxID=3119922 RepID=UPI003727FC4E